jgi:hypothetical protein
VLRDRRQHLATLGRLALAGVLVLTAGMT